MRCKKHLTDLSSSVGVCASCLRERLFVLVVAQAQAQAQQTQEDRRKSDAIPPPLPFPRSVSPYICRQKSDNSAPNYHHQRSLKDQLFFSTPQIGPNCGIIAGDLNTKKKKKKSLSLFSWLFRSKSKKADLDSSVSEDSNSRNSCTASSSLPSPSWFSSMLSGHRKKKSRFCPDESTDGFGQRTGRTRDRGMSPARVSDYGGDETEWFESSGYSSESSQSWWYTPRRAAPTARRGGGRLNHARSVRGMTLWLSPLVRASPSRHWNQKGMTQETAFSAELRVPANPHLSTASSFYANRSRKLADIGRFNHNH